MDSIKRNKQEFIDLIEKNKGIIHKIALTYSSNKADKEDLYQEICLQLWRSFGNYRGDSKLSTWLYRVALNTAISSVRKRKRFIDTVELDPERHFQVKDSDKLEATSKLMKAIYRLENIDRAIILLWLEEKKYEEISEITGLSKSAVSVRLVRVRKKLEENLKRIENE
ncbi:MAG: RNA polymerase sigma factor [Bacteroidales bacterium]|jgi:RNA polymerase sigma-70 factor (ECF subfamily)|nr:RNA polymerase sigma factor [Bacteroidales bacterium]